MTGALAEERTNQFLPEKHIEFCGLALCRRIAAMLDVQPGSIREGDKLPRGWHFPLLAGTTPRSELRNDGFPGFGLPMPDLGLPRLLLLGRNVDFHADIQVGSRIERLSTIQKLQQRETAAGPSAIVTLRHELNQEGAGAPAIIETQTYMLLGPSKPSATAAAAPHNAACDLSKVITPDDTMLFQYSALGFNSHKIHLDRTYAQEIEGFPDLVVNGGLITLLLVEFLRTEMGVSPKRIGTKHAAPLFCNRPIKMASTRDGNIIRLVALNDAGTLATEMEALVA